MPSSQAASSPDAALFAALLNARPAPGQPDTPDLADLVLRLAGSVRRSSSALREASACLAAEGGAPRLPGLLARAEAASRDQAECAAALIRRLAPNGVAA